MLQNLIEQLKQAHIAEWIGMLAGVVQVILAWKNKSINFLFGIISVSAFMVLFYKGKLYADMSLNFYYLIISIIGWTNWSKGKNILAITQSNRKDFYTTSTIALASFCISYFILKNYTDSQLPLADSSLSAFAWAGTWLMAKRKLENWIWLNISNLIAIPLYMYKGYALTTIYTIILFVVACIGYWDWRKKIV